LDSASRNETKNGKTFEVPLPGELIPEFNRYIYTIRPIFQRDASPHGFLWISKRGLPMSDATLRRIIKSRTAEALGFPVSPHRFRHAAVTFLAMNHPESIAMASDLLGHSHPAITEAYYNLIRPQHATTIIQDNLIDQARRAPMQS
jgi:integrase/recombinase XerD